MKGPSILNSANSKLHLAAIALLFSLAISASAQTAPAAPGSTATTHSAQPWTKIPIPPLHAFKPVQPKRIELTNGLVIFLQEDHELPFINGSILIRGGSRDEPAAKTGLTGLYGQTWRTRTPSLAGTRLPSITGTRASMPSTNKTLTTALRSTHGTWRKAKSAKSSPNSP